MLRDCIEASGSEEQKADRLVELNVLEQLRNITKTRTVQIAWKNEHRPTLHGWVFNMNDG